MKLNTRSNKCVMQFRITRFIKTNLATPITLKKSGVPSTHSSKLAMLHLAGIGNEGPGCMAVEDSAVPTTTEHLLVLSHTHVDPPPFLDVLSFHSSRLLPESRKQIEAHELELKKMHGLLSSPSPCGSKSSVTLTPEEETARLDELLSSVHLLLEPIQLPDLSHTGIFDPTTSLLRPVTPSASKLAKPEAEPPTKMKFSKLDKSDEIKLFYPTGAKNSNMRDFIKETIQKHFSADNPEQISNDKSLGMSASAPIFRSPVKASELDGHLRSTSPSKVRASTKMTKKKNKLKGIKSPVNVSLASGALLNPELSRQARDVITAVRANSSKINDLIAK